MIFDNRYWSIPAALAALVVAASCGTESAAPQAGPTATISSVATSAPCGTLAPTLDAAGHAHGKLIGSAYRTSFEAGDPCYQRTALAEFGSLTTEIGTMTNTVAPQEGQYDFAEADAVSDLAAANGKDFQIHSVVWDPTDHPEWGIVPEWIRTQDAAQRHRTLTTLVTDVIGHFRGRSSAVTVANEVFDQLGNLQHSAWWETTRSDQYIVDAFRAARIADPYATLYYNDHSSETFSKKSDAIYALLQKLRSETVDVEVDGELRTLPLVDGMGFQTHMVGGPDQPDTDDMRRNFQRFADLGLKIRFTEMDVRTPVTDGMLAPADAAVQREVYHTISSLCAEQPACTGITLWGFTDKRSWITDYPATFSGWGAANVYDTDYQRKLAWDGIYAALSGE